MSYISYNTKKGRIRQQSPELAAYFRSIAEDNSDETSRLKRNVRRALMEELTDRQRQFLLMYYAENIPQIEIAKICGVYPSTVYRTLLRAEKRLGKCLKYGADRVMLGLYED